MGVQGLKKIDLLTHKASIVILLTVWHVICMISALRMWCRIKLYLLFQFFLFLITFLLESVFTQ